MQCITVLLPAQACSAGYATMKPFPQERETPFSDMLKLLQPKGKYTVLPAMHNHGPSICWVTGLDPSQESEDWSGVFWDSVIRPSHELELSQLCLLIGAILLKTKSCLA